MFLSEQSRILHLGKLICISVKGNSQETAPWQVWFHRRLKTARKHYISRTSECHFIHTKRKHYVINFVWTSINKHLMFNRAYLQCPNKTVMPPLTIRNINSYKICWHRNLLYHHEDGSMILLHFNLSSFRASKLALHFVLVQNIN
jgi:hypothetical protein